MINAFLSIIFLQADGGGPAASGTFGPQLLMLVAMGAVLVFMVILPQQRQRKKQKQFQENLKKGLNVKTYSGIHGKVTEVGDDTVEVEVARNVRMTFDKAAISVDSVKPAEKK